MADDQRLLLGQILIERGLITDEQLTDARNIQDNEVAASGERRILGEILIASDMITASDRDAALSEQRRRIADTTVGPYRIVDKLGQGGMGAVYRARIPDTNIEVALKLLPARLAADPNYLARFRREALVGISMNHPAIVRTVDFGESKGTYYLAMEVVEGGTLDARLRNQDRMDEREAFTIALDLLDALEYAKGRGLVHRDVKPSNILFDSTGKPKLSDFGLAKDQTPDPSFMTAGYTVGTPHYMAPEQARGLPDIDIRADLYSLGATLYHAVAGTTPYQGTSTQLLMTRVRHEAVPSPRHFNPTLSLSATAVIAKLMAKDRDRRYASPLLAREDVQRVLDGQQPLALPANSSDEHSGFRQAVNADTHRGNGSSGTRRRSKQRLQRLIALGIGLLAVAGVIWWFTRHAIGS